MADKNYKPVLTLNLHMWTGLTVNRLCVCWCAFTVFQLCLCQSWVFCSVQVAPSVGHWGQTPIMHSQQWFYLALLLYFSCAFFHLLMLYCCFVASCAFLLKALDLKVAFKSFVMLPEPNACLVALMQYKSMFYTDLELKLGCLLEKITVFGNVFGLFVNFHCT